MPSTLDRRILAHWHEDKLNTAEIARVLGLTEAEVHNRLGWLWGHEYAPREGRGRSPASTDQ